ncbi:MAG TPA: hypothetical protein VGR19_11865 [Allosphingosinicella sp.]|nr:hypothetical protein [Allosphingosinicella sp.]
MTAQSKIPQGNIDGAVRLIREALGPGADGRSLHRALELLTSEEEVPAPTTQEGTSFVVNTEQPGSGAVDARGTGGQAMDTSTQSQRENSIQSTGDGDQTIVGNAPASSETIGGENAATSTVTASAGTGGADAYRAPNQSAEVPATQGSMDEDDLKEQERQREEEEQRRQEEAERQRHAQATNRPDNDPAAGAANADAGSDGTGGSSSSDADAGSGTDDDSSTPDESGTSLRTKADREGVLDGNIDQVKAAIKTASASELRKLRDEEQAGKTRVGVIEAIDAQLEKLGS